MNSIGSGIPRKLRIGMDQYLGPELVTELYGGTDKSIARGRAQPGFAQLHQAQPRLQRTLQLQQLAFNPDFGGIGNCVKVR